jgi:hypothetical protein
MTSTTEQQPAIKWEIKKWGPDRILPVKVVKETDKTLWIERTNWNGEPSTNQRRKTNDFHDTWEDAHNELLRRANENVDHQKWKLDRAQFELGEIVWMRPPAPESQP